MRTSLIFVGPPEGVAGGGDMADEKLPPGVCAEADGSEAEQDGEPSPVILRVSRFCGGGRVGRGVRCCCSISSAVGENRLKKVYGGGVRLGSGSRRRSLRSSREVGIQMKRFGWRRLTCSLPRIVDSTRQSSRRTGHVYVAGSKVPRKRIALIECWGGLGADGSLMTKETWKRPNAKKGGRRVALHGGISRVAAAAKDDASHPC